MHAKVLFLYIIVFQETRAAGHTAVLIYDGLLIAVSGYIHFITSKAITAYRYLLVEYYYALCIFRLKFVNDSVLWSR
jgi:hypothetical protein